MAKPAPKIVARNFTEAHAFAREVLKLSKGKYRVASTSASLFGSTGVVHLVPGWTKRSDRFSIQNKLRFTRLEVIDHEAAEENSGEDQSDLTSNGDNMLSEGAPVFTIFSDPDAWLRSTEEMFQVPVDLVVEINDEMTKVIEATETEADKNAEEARTALAADETIEVEEVAAEDDPDAEPVMDEHFGSMPFSEADHRAQDDDRPLNGRRRRRCKDCGELIHPDDVEEHAAEEEKKRERLA